MSIQPFVKCSDISKSIAFYTRILDFNVVVAPDPNPESFMSKYSLLERQGDKLHLSAHENDGVFGNVVYVQVDNIDDLYKKFLGNGLVESSNSGLSMELLEQTWGMKEFAVKDCDGNRLTFGQSIYNNG